MKSDYFAIDHDPHLVNALVIHSEEGSNWSFPTHSHGTSTELSLLVEGQTEIQMGGCIYTLEPGDIIMKIDGQDISKLPVDECSKKMRGNPGTT